jgi:hypothetical protein
MKCVAYFMGGIAYFTGEFCIPPIEGFRSIGVSKYRFDFGESKFTEQYQFSLLKSGRSGLFQKAATSILHSLWSAPDPEPGSPGKAGKK